MPLTKSQCPQCAANGKDTRGDNLVTYTNGTQRCYACGYHKGEQLEVPANLSAASLYFPPSNQIYGIEYDTAAFFALTSDGHYTYFHYFNEVGTLVGIKTRNYAAEFAGSHKHQTIRYDGALTLYGLHTLQNTRSVVLVEGESDTLYVWQSLNGTYDVLGIPGASASKVLTDYVPLLTTYEQIIVLADNDVAGVKLRNDVYKMLPDWLTYEANYPSHANDSRECTPDELLDAVSNAELHSVETHVIVGKDAHVKAATDNEFNTRLILSLHNQFPGVNRLLGGGLHAGDFVGLLGNSGKGKSTLLTQIASIAINNCTHVLYVANESSATFVSASLSKTCSVDLLGKFCVVAETYDYEALLALLNKYASQLVIIDVINSIAPDFVDHVKTGEYMRRLLKFANNSGASLLLSCHTTAANEQFKPLPLRLSDAAGGRAVQRALNGVLAFTNDVANTPENSRLVTLTKKFRNRQVADDSPTLLNYNPATNSYFEYMPSNVNIEVKPWAPNVHN
jgi:archaellum biogenesis ATPase FlaH/5S rRNA maturation endonuclease (ribonuclease M5)